jgi:hypothetical protein
VTWFRYFRCSTGAGAHWKNVNLQDQLSDLLPVRFERFLMHRFRVLRINPQTLPAIFQECLDPFLDLPVLQILFPGSIHNGFLALDDL